MLPGRRLPERRDGRCAFAIEITESGAGIHLARERSAAARMCRMGVWLAIDELGTGDSPIGGLAELLFDPLKIDLSFGSELFGSTKSLNLDPAAEPPAGCLARRNEASEWFYDNELRHSQAPRGACPGGVAVITRPVTANAVSM